MHTSDLARMTNATLPRLSRVLTGLERKGLVQRRTLPEDRRAKDVVLTEAGWSKVVDVAPGHVDEVRGLVFDRLTPEQVQQLAGISDRLLDRLDPGREVFAQER